MKGRAHRHPHHPPDERESGAEPSAAEGPGEIEPEAEAEVLDAPPAPAAAAPAGAAAAEEAAGLRDRWLRAEAELQNFRRRARRDAEESARAAEERVMREISAALDDLDRALASAAGAPEAWTAGVRLTAQRLREYLAREGVRMLDPIGKPFDPALHEAILEMDAPEGIEPGHVVQVILKGYARGERSLRPARVVVARAPRSAAD